MLQQVSSFDFRSQQNFNVRANEPIDAVHDGGGGFEELGDAVLKCFEQFGGGDVVAVGEDADF